MINTLIKASEDIIQALANATAKNVGFTWGKASETISDFRWCHDAIGSMQTHQVEI